MANKTYLNICLDVNESMFLQHAMRTSFAFLLSQITQLVVNAKSTEIGLTTFGKYSLEESEIRCIEMSKVSIETITELDRLEKEVAGAYLSYIGKTVTEDGSKRNHMVNSIVEANRLLETKKLTATANRMLLLMTDGESDVPNMDSLRGKILRDLLDSKVAVYVILLDKCTSESNPTKASNAKCLRYIADSTGGRYLEASALAECHSIFAAVPGLTVTPRAAKISLQLSPQCIIPCTYYSKISKMTLPTLKKFSKAGAGDGAVDDAGGLAKRDTTYRNPDDPDEEVLAEDRVKGYKYGSQYIPISGTEEEGFKVLGPAIIELIGFISNEKLPRHHFMDATTIVQGDMSSASNGLSAAVAIASIATAMKAENKVALVRFVKKENSDPIMAVLTPSTCHDGTLLLHRVPFVEDYREFSFPSLPEKSTFNIQQTLAMSNFVDSITVTSPSAAHVLPCNPSLKVLVDYIGGKIRKIESPRDKIIKKGTHEYPLSSILMNISDPFISIQSDERAAHVKQLMSMFPLRKRDSKEDKKKTYWSDIRIQSNENRLNRDGTVQITVGEDYGNDSKRAKTEGTLLSQEIKEEMYNGPTITAGSITPVEDFQAVADYCSSITESPVASDAINRAISVIEDIVTMLVTLGGTQAHYRKAVACVKAYRRVAVSFHVSHKYNQFMREVIKMQFFSGKHAGFWRLLAAEPIREITLISSDEDTSSDVSHDTAMTFTTNEVVPMVVAAPAPVAAPEDDLFDDMA